MTKVVTVRRVTPNGVILSARIDEVDLHFDVEGTAKATCEANRSHVLDYFVRGQPGGTYTVMIVNPEESKLVRSDTLDSAGLDAGHAWFWVG